VRQVPADRHVGRLCRLVTGRHVRQSIGAGGQVGRFWRTARVVAGDRLPADTRLAFDPPIRPAQLEQCQNASLIGHLEVVPH
jgi:hypothetical protein